MSYIITAEVRTTSEENLFGDKTKVDARILSEREGYIEFDINGDFRERAALTKRLCESLIDAGYLSFTIGHSY